MALIWKRVKDRSNENHPLKCLILLEFLLREGNADMVMKQIQKNLVLIEQLKHFTLYNEHQQDLGTKGALARRVAHVRPAAGRACTSRAGASARPCGEWHELRGTSRGPSTGSAARTASTFATRRAATSRALALTCAVRVRLPTFRIARSSDARRRLFNLPARRRHERCACAVADQG